MRYLYTNTHSVSDAITYLNVHSHAVGDGNGNSQLHSNANSYRDGYTYGQRYNHTGADTDTDELGHAVLSGRQQQPDRLRVVAVRGGLR